MNKDNKFLKKILQQEKDRKIIWTRSNQEVFDITVNGIQSLENIGVLSFADKAEIINIIQKGINKNFKL